MSTSPFKRRANPSKTYSKRASLASTSRASNVTQADSDVAKLLVDSSDDEPSAVDSDSDRDVARRLLGRNSDPVERSSASTRPPRRSAQTSRIRSEREDVATSAGTDRADSVGDEPTLSRSRSLRTRTSTQNGTQDSTNWDEQTAATEQLMTRARGNTTTGRSADTGPSRKSPTTKFAPKRQVSPRKPQRTMEETPATVAGSNQIRRRSSSPPPVESAEHSDPPSPPSRKRRRKSAPQPLPAENSSQVVPKKSEATPPPLDHVPLRRSLRSSPDKTASLETDEIGAPKASSSTVLSTSAPLIRTILPSSSSPAKPPPRPVSPLPAQVQSLRSPSRGAHQPRRPPSPAAKDLSSLFSSFSRPVQASAVELSGDESSSSSIREGIKRNSSGGIVAALAAKKASERNDRSRATTPNSPERPTRAPLDRSLSQSSFTSPLSSPHAVAALRSPQRPPFGTTSSLPDLLSPTRSRSGSTSPSKGANLHHAPALGSAYRPVSFSASTAPSGLAEGGRTRTYGGARSFRSDTKGQSAEGVTLSNGSTTAKAEPSSLAAHLPTLPPSLTQRLPNSSLARDTYSQLREKWGVAAEEELDEDEAHESQERGARVIGTGILRAQGEGKRWTDEIGWTLDGLRDGQGGSGARSSALELLGKTLEREWIRRLKSSGMVEQVYLAFRRGGAGSGDRILDTALVVLLASFSRDQRLCEPLFRLSTSDVLESNLARGDPSSPSRSTQSSPRKEHRRNCELLEALVDLSRRDWAKEDIGVNTKETGARARISKSDARHMQSLRDIIDKSGFFEDTNTPITLRSLILKVVQAVARFDARPIFQPQQLLCTTGAFESVIFAFLDECQFLEQRIEKYSSGLDILPDDASVHAPSFSTAVVDLCLSVFEATSLSTPDAFDIVSSTTHLGPLSQAFIDLTLVSVVLAFGGESSFEAESRFKLLLSILGITFGLATEPVWTDTMMQVRHSSDDGILGVLIRTALKCRQTSRSRRHSTQHDADASGESRPEWDVLCLILGTVTNMVESSDEARDALRETLVDPDCRSGRKCVRNCACPLPRSALAILSSIYLDPLDDAPNTVYRTSVGGFLRLLLGLSLLDNPRNETIILEQLSQSTSIASNSSATSAIIDALDEFAKLHEEQNQTRGMLSLENGDETATQLADSPFNEKEDVIEELGRGSRHGEGDVVSSIKSTIERLRRRID